MRWQLFGDEKKIVGELFRTWEHLKGQLINLLEEYLECHSISTEFGIFPPHPHSSLSTQGRGSRGVFEIEELVDILRQEKVQSFLQVDTRKSD